MKTYAVVHSYEIPAFEQRVTQKLREGYVCVGGMQLADLGIERGIIYTQAMMREIEEGSTE